MKRKAGLLLIISGTVLLLAALSLFLYNRWEAQQAGLASEQTVQQLISVIQKQQTQTEQQPQAEDDGTSQPSASSTDSDQEEDITSDSSDQVATVTLDGYSYMGVLSIPSLGLELPVIDNWSYPGLKVAPCRYSGSISSGNLVICAHNYSTHFGNLKYLSEGAKITFTTLDGTVYTYRVTELTTIQPTAIDQLMGGDWDLALYTCTIGGKTRVVVHCVLSD